MSEIELNPEQRKAIEHGEGPLLVIAGPGSGKTRVITQRIVRLLQTTPGLRPEQILALTYTDKATAEMKSRVGKALPELTASPMISTFHAFCYHVLRRRHFDRQLLDQIDVWIFLRRRMEQLGLNFYQKLAEPGAFLHDLNEFFSRCQDELIEPDGFDDYVRGVEKDFAVRRAHLDPAELAREMAEVEKKKELARVFRTSRTLIESAGSSSLGSLVSETVHLWDREPEVLEEYRSLYHYVLVDEFQDTNFGQAELLRRLVAPDNNLTAVGDDDQAIYRFRGASHGAFAMFSRAYPGHKTVFLNRNYRSTAKILRCADAVISRNDREIKKPPLKTENGEGCGVFLVESPDYLSEAAWIAAEVDRLARRGTPLEGIAVLYRGHNYRDLLVEEFRRRKIPFAIRGLSILSTVILRDLLAYLSLVNSWHDNISLTRVLLHPRWRFPEELAYTIRQWAAKDRCSLMDALAAMERSPGQSELAKTNWAELKKILIELRQRAQQTSVTNLFDLMGRRLGMTFLPGSIDQRYLEAFRKFLDAWEQKSESRLLPEFMEYFRYFVEANGKIEAPEPKGGASGVQMMTVHAAKGLEFPVVFVLSVAPRRFPSMERKPVIEFPEDLRRGPTPPEDIHLQEERRLFFVAMTRAQERLYVSSVAQAGGKAKAGKKVSVFVDDLLSSAVVRTRDIESVEVSQISEEQMGKEPAGHARPSATRETQPSLFEGAGESGYEHPPLAQWAATASANGLVGPEGKIRLSATAVESYLECPLKFKFSHLLKIPTGPQAALTFGNIMHKCVRSYFELGRKAVPRFEDIEKIYLESWKAAGFEDTYQEDSYKKAGLEQLHHFVERQNASGVSVEHVRLEEHFAFDCGDITLEGRIDQINPWESGKSSAPAIPGGRPVELVDYKTGRPRSQKEADKSLQLSVYALAARRQLKLDPVRLTLYYLTNNQTVSTLRTSKELDGALQEIREVAENIRALRFDPTPGFVCKWCDFVAICPAHEDEK
ncbi:MAG TPA: ATP-dependent DNA helicase [Terriglobia bacterium]|nr:ATP-dependent DNA helicase [Terriglobia bacterium]